VPIKPDIYDDDTMLPDYDAMDLGGDDLVTLQPDVGDVACTGCEWNADGHCTLHDDSDSILDLVFSQEDYNEPTIEELVDDEVYRDELYWPNDDEEFGYENYDPEED
jgi:hypothetical protein